MRSIVGFKRLRLIILGPEPGNKLMFHFWTRFPTMMINRTITPIASSQHTMEGTDTTWALRTTSPKIPPGKVHRVSFTGRLNCRSLESSILEGVRITSWPVLDGDSDTTATP